MDDDDLRRGKPAVHEKFNEANALLGGASLLIYAINILTNKKFLIEKKKLILLENFSNAIGHNGMLAGQFLDLEAENPQLKLTLKKFAKIQTKKTGLLIAFCCYAGGVLGNASKKELLLLQDFGMTLGKIFQLTDDILDYEGSQKKLGKKVNKDKDLNKATIIREKGMNYAKNEIIKNSIIAKNKLSNLKKNTEDLSHLIDYICARSS